MLLRLVVLYFGLTILEMKIEIKRRDEVEFCKCKTPLFNASGIIELMEPDKNSRVYLICGECQCPVSWVYGER